MGYLFYERVRTYGYRFQKPFTFSVFMDMVFVNIHLKLSFFGISGFMGILFGNLSGFMDGTFKM